MGLLDQRPDGCSSASGSYLVLDGRFVRSVESLRPMAWVVLEAVALAATIETDGLVAHTSARQLAQLLGVDPGTAAAALRLLRQRGLLELRRTGGERGRFGLSAYVLGDIGAVGIRPCAGPPGAVAPHAAEPHAAEPHAEPCSGVLAATPPSSRLPAGGIRRSEPRRAEQGALELGLEDDG